MLPRISNGRVEQAMHISVVIFKLKNAAYDDYRNRKNSYT